MYAILPIETIVSDPDVRGGRPIIAGTQIRVQDVAAAYVFQGMTVEDIAVNYGLAVGSVHAALAYFYAHRAEFDAQFADDERTADTLHKEFAAQGRVLP
jgi:uncharacterized protein (DUF433 family)